MNGLKQSGRCPMREETDLEKYLPHLKSVKVFHWLHEIELRKLLMVATRLRVGEGETIINQGEIGNHIYIIIKGQVEVSIKNQHGQKVSICTIGEGEIFGEAAIFLASKRSATVACLAESEVIRISRQDLVRFFKAHPSAGNKLLML